MISRSRYPVFVGVKLSEELAEQLRQAAREDDRPLSAWMRRALAAAVERRTDGRS